MTSQLGPRTPFLEPSFQPNLLGQESGVSRGLSSTLISVLCHVVNIFCLSSHPQLAGSNSRSKFQAMRAKIVLISVSARLKLKVNSGGFQPAKVCKYTKNNKHRDNTYFLPMQLRGPNEKACIAAFLSAEKASSPNHLSGQNVSAC